MFYPLELENDKEAIENALNNPGTLFVKKVTPEDKKSLLKYVFVSPEYFELMSASSDKKQEENIIELERIAEENLRAMGILGRLIDPSNELPDELKLELKKVYSILHSIFAKHSKQVKDFLLECEEIRKGTPFS